MIAILPIVIVIARNLYLLYRIEIRIVFKLPSNFKLFKFPFFFRLRERIFIRPCSVSFFLRSRMNALLLSPDARHLIPDIRYRLSDAAYLRAPEIANDPTTIRFYQNFLRKISIDVIRAMIISLISSIPTITFISSIPISFVISIV